MLREITTVRSYSDDRRRWFSDADMDLFVWFRNQMPVQFQLSFNKQYEEHAITWDYNKGFIHSKIDDGEGRPGRYKMTPIMLDEGNFDCNTLARHFLQQSELLEPTLADFIFARLMEYPDTYTQSASLYADEERVR